MIEEVLIALNGCPGDIFYPPIGQEFVNDENGNRIWTVAPELMDFLHPGEQELLRKLLILSSYVVSFEDFIRQYNTVALFDQIIHPTGIGQSEGAEIRFVNQDRPIFGAYAACLSEGFTSILQTYRSRLINLENDLCKDGQILGIYQPTNAFSRIYGDLQSYFRIFPAMEKLRSAFGGRSQVRNGGEILSFMCRLIESERADQIVRSELDTLLRRCLAPFRSHLLQWLTTGGLSNDRFGEFFIQKSTDGLFKIEKTYLPSFISETVAEKILFIGKSVGLMAESSKSGLDEWEASLAPLSGFLRSLINGDGSNGSEDYQYGDFAFELEKQIELIRRAASEKLYARCFEDTKANHALEAWVKNAFFIGKGELFLAFVDAAESALASPITSEQLEMKTRALTDFWTKSMEKIYWLNDEERQCFNKISPHFDIDQVAKGKAESGWQAVRLNLKTPQQLAPIFTPHFVAELNVVFCFLLRWRRTQLLIESCWAQLKKSSPKVIQSLPSLDKVHQLTSLMLFVVKNLQYYIQADVLETVYAKTIKEISSCRDFAHVLKVLHDDMMDEIFANCFLKRETWAGDNWQAKVGKILKTFGEECDTFSSTVLAKLRAAEDNDDGGLSTPERDRVFAARIHECYVNFQRKTALLFKMLTTSKTHDNSACLNRLLLRLDFNLYFSSTQLFSA